MKDPRITVIVNPHAAGGKAGRRWPELRGPIAERLGGTLTDRFTAERGDATRLTREALRDGADVVVALGGDGSVNEVANGFFEPLEPPGPGPGDLPSIRRDAALAVLPFGTGGDFRKSLHLPNDTLAAAEIAGNVLRAGAALPRIDVGFGDLAREDGPGRTARLFVNIASCGQSGVVSRFSNTMSKALGGRVTFLLATVRGFFAWKNRPVLVTADDEPPRELIINTFAMGNGRYFGGGMKVCPDARLGDGVLDVTVIGDVGLGEFITKGKRLYDGRIGTLAGVTCMRARRVHLEPAGTDPRPVPVEMEGENVGQLPATFTVHASQLAVVADLRS